MGLDAIERAVLHCATDMMRQGIHPSGDRLCEELEDHPEGVIRHTRMQLIASGKLVITTTPDSLIPEPDGDPLDGVGSKTVARTAICRKRAIARTKENNLAILRIMEGRGSLLQSISTLTGLSPNAVKMRARQARYKYTSEEIDDVRADELDSDQLRSIQKRYGDILEVQDFLGRIHTAHRSRPDTRTDTKTA